MFNKNEQNLQKWPTLVYVMCITHTQNFASKNKNIYIIFFTQRILTKKIDDGTRSKWKVQQISKELNLK